MHLSAPDHADRFIKVAAIIFFAWVALIFTFPIGEGDFFWHVKTGQWIWEHKSLPVSDPFSFTVKDVNPYNPGSGRIPFLLKQYWLGQLSFYGIWKIAGEAGMVAFRSICYTGILFFLYRWTKQLRNGMLPLLAIAIVGNVLRNYGNERPQIFGFILMPLLIFILEKIRISRCLNGGLWPALTLPLVMLLWSNCHGSFILGIVVIALYAASSIIDRVRGQDSLNRLSLFIMATAILASFANPNGYEALRASLFSASKSYTSLIAEYTSPIILAWKFHVFDYFYWVLVIAALITVIIYIKEMKTAHLLVICSLLGLSLTATRYIPFFVLAAPILCIYIPEWRYRKSNIFLNLLPVLIILTLVATADYRNVLKFRAEQAFPVKASSFLNDVKPHGNMFNYVGWGGYLMCYNSYPVFIDGRTLIEELLPIHNSILAGRDWQSIMDKYDINFMIIPGTDIISLQAYPLLLQLLGENNWSIIYQDNVALILLRNSPENREIIKQYAVDKASITSHIQARWKWQMANDY